MREILNFSNEKNMAETFPFNIGICVGAKLLAILHPHFLRSFQKDMVSHLPSSVQSFIPSLIHIHSILLTTTTTTTKPTQPPVLCDGL